MKYVFFFLFLFCIDVSFAQHTSSSSTKSVSKSSQKNPEFPGGIEGLAKYLQKNIQYPKEAMQAGIEGKVIVSFVIDKQGLVQNAKIIKSMREDFDEEALRVVRAMPKWRPGTQKGKRVAVSFNLPIAFKLN